MNNEEIVLVFSPPLVALLLRAEEQGYADVDTENCWSEWNIIRKELIDE